MKRSNEIQDFIHLKIKKTVGQYMEDLKSPDVEVRRGAIEMLEFRCDKNEVPLLPILKSLKDEDAEVRANAAYFLNDHEDPAVITPLIAALEDLDAHVRGCAAQALGTFKVKVKVVQAVAPLIKKLEDSDANVRDRAAYALGKIRDKAAVDPLLKALREDLNADVRAEAAYALEKIRDDKAIPALEQAAQNDETPEVRRAAQAAVKGIKKTVNEYLKDLENLDLGAEERYGAIDELAFFNKELVPLPLIIAALKDKKWEVRASAADFLNDCRYQGDLAVINPLIAALQDVGSAVQYSSAHALGTIKVVQAVPSLIDKLKDPKASANVRYRVACALGEIGDKAAANPLIDALRSPDIRVRAGAATALGVMQDSRVIPALEQVAQEDEAPKVIEAAQAALKKLSVAVASDVAVTTTTATTANFSVTTTTVSPVVFRSLQQQVVQQDTEHGL